MSVVHRVIIILESICESEGVVSFIVSHSLSLELVVYIASA